MCCMYRRRRRGCIALFYLIFIWIRPTHKHICAHHYQLSDNEISSGLCRFCCSSKKRYKKSEKNDMETQWHTLVLYTLAYISYSYWYGYAHFEWVAHWYSWHAFSAQPIHLIWKKQYLNEEWRKQWAHRAMMRERVHISFDALRFSNWFASTNWIIASGGGEHRQSNWSAEVPFERGN